MGTRLDLHEKLCDILGSRQVYFQPPETVNIKYPCIIYNRTDIEQQYADNKTYRWNHRYMISIVDEDPDSLIPDKLLDFEMCTFDRHYTQNNLNHDIYLLYW